jgi:hypothetical protein
MRFAVFGIMLVLAMMLEFHYIFGLPFAHIHTVCERLNKYLFSV